MVVKFSDDATHATMAAVLNDLREWVINFDHENEGYPHNAMMIRGVTTDSIGEVVIVCETDDAGGAIVNSTWAVPIDGLRSVTVL